MATNDQDTPVMITILGPTATGKTRLAAAVAAALDGEVISADSRQVYRGMDIGTGKDYDDYVVEGKTVPYHLVDIADPGYEYNVFEFQNDFLKAFSDLVSREKTPVLCGGTGMYLEAVLSGYKLVEVPENTQLRERLRQKNMHELTEILKSLREVHNITDLTDRDRTMRAIEIAEFEKSHPRTKDDFPKINHRIYGIRFERRIIRERITLRLKQRLEEGMIEEVGNLLRYLTDYVTGKISYEEMFRLLNTAIHQFAKRQMTWFRRMEKKGFKIQWIDGNLPLEQKVDLILKL